MLWKIQTKKTRFTDWKEEIVYSEGALSVKGKVGIIAVPFKYKVKSSNVPPIIFDHKGKRYVLPYWLEVHPQTTLTDIFVEKEKVKKTSYEVLSERTGEKYTVKFNPTESKWTCNCTGFHRLLVKEKGCKHIQQIRDSVKENS